MPLLDHFHPPVKDLLPWEALHSAWATRLADTLNERWLPDGFLATERTHLGARLEIDVATFELPTTPPPPPANGSPVATLPRTWAPPAARWAAPVTFPDCFEVRITTPGGWHLLAAIELISPANKDRPAERQAFATKCAGYLHQGASVVLIDVVTSRHANLHTEVLRLLGLTDAAPLPEGTHLYAASYRPVLREERSEIDVWVEPCVLGAPLPVMPLRLTGDWFVPVEFETTYTETCRRRRLL